MTDITDTTELEAQPIHYHDCPAFGPNTIVPRGVMLSKDKKILLGRQHKCPMCSYTAGEFQAARGVEVLGDGRYSVDMSKAEYVEAA